MDSEIFQALINWCGADGNVRAAVLTSSRARHDGTADVLSDFDLELYVRDISPFSGSDSWLERFGAVLVRWPLTAQPDSSSEWLTRLVQYEEGTRIDFQITTRPLAYHDSFDAGYEILIDKDGLGNGMPPARRERLFIARPTEEEFLDRVNSFLWDILYIPKALKRDELFWASYMRDRVIRFNCLMPMLEWYAAMNHGWQLDTNKYGRWIKASLPGEIWSLCERTFSGSDPKDNSLSVHAMAALFSRLARDVARGLGYSYPEEQEKKILAYMEKIENTNLKGTSLLNKPAEPV